METCILHGTPNLPDRGRDLSNFDMRLIMWTARGSSEIHVLRAMRDYIRFFFRATYIHSCLMYFALCTPLVIMTL